MKILKILGIAILALVVILMGVVFYVSVGFGKLEFDDRFEATQDYTTYFPDSYDDAKVRFDELTGKLKNQFSGVQTISFRVPSGVDEELFTDLCYIPAQEDSTNLLVISSGVHGVEGFTGHAVQEMFVQEFLDTALLANTGVLLIHAVNPYGFKYIRRVTENNVDLNRNSAVDNDLYETQNTGYPEVYELINPDGEVKVRSFYNRFFFVQAINEIRKASLPVLRQAVLQGQYDFPEGLYFGGNHHEPQIDSLKPILQKFTLPYDRIKMIDLHTGYGQRGRLHFFPNPMEGEQRARMESLYDGFVIDWGDSDDFYTVTGDFAGFVGDLNPAKEFYPMVFEYGTLNSQTTMGSLKSIHIMILENQGHQYGYVSEEDSLKVKSDIHEMYFPSSENWQNHIMQQTHDVFEVLLPRFTAKKN